MNKRDTMAQQQDAAVAVLTAHATMQRAPHHRMVVSKYNVRTKLCDNQDLKASVRAVGVIQNLTGYLQVVDGRETGMIEIVCGRRRHAVVGELIAEGDLPEDFQLDYLLVTEDEAIDVSLAENTMRTDMHPADVFEAMLAMTRHGRAIEDIALAFRLPALEVKRRLKLANVSPRLFALYRNDQADLRHMMALAISDDHAAQESAWDSLPAHGRSPHELRRLLTAQQIDISTDRLGRFVGAAAYEKAGGVITRDLFSDSGAGYISDVALLERLAQAELDKQRGALLKEGAQWVEVLPRSDTAALADYGRVRVETAPLDEDRQAWLAAFEERLALVTERLMALEGGADSEDEGVPEGQEAAWEQMYAECDELTAQIRALQHDRPKVPNPQDAALAGAVVTLDHEGKPVLLRGMIRAADKAAQARMAPAAASSASSSVPVKRERAVHSDRLTQVLTSHRTAALQAEMMAQRDTALVYLTYTLMAQVMRGIPRRTLCGATLARPALAAETREGGAVQALAARKAELLAALPGGEADDGWLPWLASQPQSVVLDYLAYCVALSLDALQEQAGRSDGYASLARTLGLDMARWWQPTAANYFSHVTKARMLAVVREAVSAEAAVPLEKLSSAAAAEAAERAVAGTGWLPDLLRAG